MNPTPPQKIPSPSAVALQEQPGTTPVPATGITGADLTSYWAHLHQHIDEKRKAREQPGEFSLSRAAYRYSCKIEIGIYETIIGFLHRFMAPDSVSTCGRECDHMANGMTPDQAKSFLDLLDAEAEGRAIRMSRASGQVHEDLDIEVSEIRSYRQHLAGFLR